jgi:hypothetical protein
MHAGYHHTFYVCTFNKCTLICRNQALRDFPSLLANTLEKILKLQLIKLMGLNCFMSLAYSKRHNIYGRW